MDVEPHITATVQKIPDEELRPLLADILQRLIALDGAAFTAQRFPMIGTHWVDPPRWSSQ